MVLGGDDEKEKDKHPLGGYKPPRGDMPFVYF